MPIVGAIEVVDVLAKIILGGAGLLISWAVYQQTQQRANEIWNKTYAEFHQAFWNDEIVQEVRCWLAYPRAYEPLKKVLLKRQKLFEKSEALPELNHEEYLLLDKLDKYLNTIMRAVTINPELSTRQIYGPRCISNIG